MTEPAITIICPADEAERARAWDDLLAWLRSVEADCAEEDRQCHTSREQSS